MKGQPLTGTLSDADTVGAVFGALAGTHYGIDDVPNEWIESLVARSTIHEVVEGLVKMVTEFAE